MPLQVEEETYPELALHYSPFARLYLEYVVACAKRNNQHDAPLFFFTPQSSKYQWQLVLVDSSTKKLLSPSTSTVLERTLELGLVRQTYVQTAATMYLINPINRAIRNISQPSHGSYKVKNSLMMRSRADTNQWRKLAYLQSSTKRDNCSSDQSSSYVQSFDTHNNNWGRAMDTSYAGFHR